MVETLLGMVTLIKLPHSLNALLPMVVTLLEMVTSVRRLQLLNA